MDDETGVLKKRLARMEEIFKESKTQVATSKMLDLIVASFIEAVEGEVESKSIYDRAIALVGDYWASQDEIISLIGKEESIIDSLNEFLMTVARDRLTEDTECSAYLSDRGIKLEIRNCPFLEVERILKSKGRAINCCFPGALSTSLIKNTFSLEKNYRVVIVNDENSCKIAVE